MQLVAIQYTPQLNPLISWCCCDCTRCMYTCVQAYMYHCTRINSCSVCLVSLAIRLVSCVHEYACQFDCPCLHHTYIVFIGAPLCIREDWKPVLTINSIVYGLQFLFLVSSSCVPVIHAPAVLPLYTPCLYTLSQHYSIVLSFHVLTLTNSLSLPSLPSCLDPEGAKCG